MAGRQRRRGGRRFMAGSVVFRRIRAEAGRAGGGRQSGRWQRWARILFTTDGSSWGEKMEAASVTLVWKVNTFCCSLLQSFQAETGAVRQEGLQKELGGQCVCVRVCIVKHNLDLLTSIRRAERYFLFFVTTKNPFPALYSLGRYRFSDSFLSSCIKLLD